MTKPHDSEQQRLVILDTHAILHRAYHALPDFSSPSGEPTGALYGVVAMLLRIIEDLRPTAVVAAYDLPEPTYRHTAFAAYKAHREKTDESLVAQIERSRDIFAAFGIPIFECPGFEADDILGTIAHQMKVAPEISVVIASGDMDTMQCVDGKRVQVYTLKKGIHDTVLYDEAAVIARFGFPPALVPDYKGLRGDTSDNIPGIVGIGEKTATTLVTTFGSIENLYAALARDPEDVRAKAKMTPRIISLLLTGQEEALFSKMLATIRTDAPIQFEMPQGDMRDRITYDAVLTLFSTLGFRTLTQRFQHLFGYVGHEAERSTDVTPLEESEASILLWLIDSERTNATKEEIEDYGRAFLDTTSFRKTVDRLRDIVAKTGALQSVYETIEVPLRPVLQTLNATGVLLDTSYLAQLAVMMHTELASLEASIYQVTGKEFNINSPKQLGEILFDHLGLAVKQQKKTATGQRSTKESELEKLRNAHPVIPLVLRYRELQKLVSTYVDAFPKMVSSDGRLRTTFLQTGTVTGRLSSRDPNLQNIPTRTDESRAIRRAFVAGTGNTLISIDYSQIELRIAAILSGDTALQDIFRRGEDVHTGVAMRVFGVSPHDVTSEMRRKAKVINFGILYGMGVNALRANLGEETTREEAQQFLTAYFQSFHRLASYLDETKELARRHGYTETLFGRRRHFPGIRSGAPFIRAQAERMAINAPIQGTAADIMRIAMIQVHEYLATESVQGKAKVLLQVHDEFVLEVATEIVDDVVQNVVTIMEGVLPPERSQGVPLSVAAAVGKNWADMEEYEHRTV